MTLVSWQAILISRHSKSIVFTCFNSEYAWFFAWFYNVRFVVIVLRYLATTFCYKLQIDEARVLLISVLVTLQFNNKPCSFVWWIWWYCHIFLDWRSRKQCAVSNQILKHYSISNHGIYGRSKSAIR